MMSVRDTTRAISTAATLVASEALAGVTLFVDCTNPNCPGLRTLADPFCTIQSAINAAAGGDEIVVMPCTYVETISFLGKAVNLHSDQGPEVTIIDGSRWQGRTEFAHVTPR